MTPKQFKTRWESDENGGGITFGDIASCAKAWGVCAQSMTKSIDDVCYKVLKHAGVKDAEQYAFKETDQQNLA